RAAAQCGVPLLGINLGRLGFMVDVTPDDMHQALDSVLGGEYVRDDRLMLSTTLLGEGQDEAAILGLNDTVVRNRDFARVLEFDTYIDGQFISHHRADGIIIATPTGSTAYALSGGGPVLHPSLDSFALVPICPHTLSDRPLIVNAKHAIEVVISSDISTEALVTCDGQWNRELRAGDRVRIEPASQRLQIIHPPGYDYYNLLRSKLGWGRGQRQRNPQN
ncbi:MAG: NAD(+)/NADH kinase, partial [Nevskiales bacterium]